MCPWVGPHAHSFGRQLWGLPSRVEYLSPQRVLLPLVYGTTASPLWLDAETVCHLLPEGFIVISTLSVCCASPAACCWCRVPAACL